MSNSLPHFFTICAGFYMSCINKYLFRIYKFVLHAFFKNPRKDLLKKIGIFKTTRIVFTKCREMRNGIHHIQSKKPAVSNIYFNLFHCLPHAFYSVKILNKWDFYKHDRIYAWSSVIRAVFFFYQVINEGPINSLID